MRKPIDTKQNGEVLPELNAKRKMIRIDKNTIILPKAEKVKNNKAYIDHYQKQLEISRSRI